MNILVFSWRDPKHPLAGGAEQVMHEHMKGWVSVGHKVVLFSSYFKKAKRRESLDGIEIIRKGVQLGGVQTLGFFWYIFNKHPKFDLVIDQFHGIPFFTPLFVRTKKLAVIQEVAREVWLMNHLPKPLNWMIGVLGYLLEPLIFKLYLKTPFMTGSASAREDLINFEVPPNNIFIIPHGVLPPKKIPDAVKAQIKTIAYLGSLSKDKGIEDAIKTFSILHKKGEYDFWVMGKGSKVYLSELKRMSKVLKVSNRVKFLGFVNQEEKFSLLSKAHLLINPSVREGWGLVNIEANLVGTPVVSYTSPGLVDSVKDGVSGVFTKENTPEQMAQEISSLLSNKRKYHELTLSAKNWAKNFSWSRSKEKSLALIDSVASGRYSLNH